MQGVGGGVADRLARLGEAIEAGGEFFNPFVTAQARIGLRRAGDRLDAGIGITVAALVGGTGSGKSSLFNAITELAFAEVGELRPTTREPSACLWNVEADDLMAMLGIPAERRIAHGSLLIDDDGALDGLVLVDLPDHDSVELGNAALLERMLPMVDVVMWVVDPQKYADQLLHEGYLAGMRARREQTVVILNQVDAIPQDKLDILITDVHRLLAQDGLEGVPVIPASVPEGRGLQEIRDRLAQAVAQTDAVVKAAEAELDAIRARLAKELGSSHADLSDRAVADVEERLEKAVGLDAVVSSIEKSGEGFRQLALAKPEQPAASMISALRDSWVANVRSGLPDTWQKAIEAAVPASDKMRRAVTTEVRDIPAVPVSKKPRILLLVVGAVVALAAIVMAVLGYTGTICAQCAGSLTEPFPWAVVAIPAVGILVFLACVWIGKRHQRVAAENAAQKYRNEARTAIAGVVEDMFVKPASDVLARYERTCAALS